MIVTATGNRLEVIGGELPEPPYPDDVRARGWPFDLDLERIKQSSTWMRAPQELRAHLIRLWAESWQQSPCGSLPGQDDDIAALLEMPPNLFAANRQALMRGWVIHRNGRLYHRVITEMVLTMMGARRRDRERKALAKKDSDGFQRIPKDSAAASASASASAVNLKTPQAAANAIADLAATMTSPTSNSTTGGFSKRQDFKPGEKHNPNWKVPSLDDHAGLDRCARDMGIRPESFPTYADLQRALIDKVRIANAEERRHASERPPKDLDAIEAERKRQLDAAASHPLGKPQ